ncbi:membrane protein YczE [Rhodococcus sp. UNC363MFTsu5.1]|uniref:membrane protein YczE n=1 Tax=Rhodococcus sp. UNC363MFTsu5.1 TaxID=1449069 RepID=UPI00056539A4|nr:membrane protein [Rhodococcus sp. UNC363MFTsu5.1]
MFTRLPARLVALFVGLWLYGFSMALMVVAGLGLDPWDVFHQGVAQRTSLSFGTVIALTGAAVLLLWIPIRQRPGFGTVANVVVIAVSVDTSLALLPELDAMGARILVMLFAVVLNALATALYIGAGLGPGPRDGLMTGLAARTGLSVRLVRTGIEVAVLATGWMLGGTVGVGTVVYALGIGPLIQLMMRLMSRGRLDPRVADAAPAVPVPSVAQEECPAR